MEKLYRTLLQPFIAIRSISAHSSCAGELRSAADYLVALFQEAGFSVRQLPSENPVVFAEYQVGEDKPCILIYGHYDVQPADEREGWESDPFVLTEREERLFGRGTADNKGQCLLHIAAIFQLIKEKKLAANIKFLIEGNEETGSQYLGHVLQENADLLNCDCMLISDSELLGTAPTLDRGFRGVANLLLEVRTSPFEVHSGIFGGAIPNAAHELSRAVATLYDSRGNLKIHDFCPTIEETATPFDAAHYQSLTGCACTYFPVKNPAQSLGLIPAVQVTSLESGYQGEGFRNSVPGSARAKINLRIPANGTTDEYLAKLREHFSTCFPDYVTWELNLEEQADGAVLEEDEEYYPQARKVLQEVYGQPVVGRFSGGSLPVIHDFAQIMNVPQLLVALANEDCRMHECNENISLEAVQKGLQSSYEFFSRVKPSAQSQS